MGFLLSRTTHLAILPQKWFTPTHLLSVPFRREHHKTQELSKALKLGWDPNDPFWPPYTLGHRFQCWLLSVVTWEIYIAISGFHPLRYSLIWVQCRHRKSSKLLTSSVWGRDGWNPGTPSSLSATLVYLIVSRPVRDPVSKDTVDSMQKEWYLRLSTHAYTYLHIHEYVCTPKSNSRCTNNSPTTDKFWLYFFVS